jgi:hypothetical protein
LIPKKGKDFWHRWKGPGHITYENASARLDLLPTESGFDYNNNDDNDDNNNNNNNNNNMNMKV